jgi:hypothetical protein
MRPYTTALNPSGDSAPWKIVQAINQLLRGKANNVSDVTLTQSSTTTVILNPLIGPDSHITITPLTTNAATALVGWYVSSRAAGTATITHTLNANTDLDCTLMVDG